MILLIVFMVEQRSEYVQLRLVSFPPWNEGAAHVQTGVVGAALQRKVCELIMTCSQSSFI